MTNIEDYRQFVAEQRGREDTCNPTHVSSLIQVIDKRLSDPTFKDKHKQYRAERKRLESVLAVMEA